MSLSLLKSKAQKLASTTSGSSQVVVGTITEYIDYNGETAVKVLRADTKEEVIITFSKDRNAKRMANSKFESLSLEKLKCKEANPKKPEMGISKFYVEAGDTNLVMFGNCWVKGDVLETDFITTLKHGSVVDNNTVSVVRGLGNVRMFKRKSDGRDVIVGTALLNNVQETFASLSPLMKKRLGYEYKGQEHALPVKVISSADDLMPSVKKYFERNLNVVLRIVGVDETKKGVSQLDGFAFNLNFNFGVNSPVFEVQYNKVMDDFKELSEGLDKGEIVVEIVPVLTVFGTSGLIEMTQKSPRNINAYAQANAMGVIDDSSNKNLFVDGYFVLWHAEEPNERGDQPVVLSRFIPSVFSERYADLVTAVSVIETELGSLSPELYAESVVAPSLSKKEPVVDPSAVKPLPEDATEYKQEDKSGNIQADKKNPPPALEDIDDDIPF